MFAERNFVPPLGSTELTIKLSSPNVNESMQRLYRVKCSIGSTPTLLVRGKVEALDISLKTSFVAFGDMKQGVKKLFCLVKGAAHPLPLHVVATCTSDTEYPARITQGHVHLEQWRLFTQKPLKPGDYEVDALGCPMGVPLPEAFPPSFFLAAVDDFPVHKKQVARSSSKCSSESSGVSRPFKLVSWRGRADGGVSKEVLEVVAYPSAQRNHQATTPESLVVPQLLQLRVSGVSVSSTPPPPPLREALAAAVVLPESNVRMPPCAVGQIVWRVLEILNRGDEILDFEIFPMQKVEEALAAGRRTDDLRQFFVDQPRITVGENPVVRRQAEFKVIASSAETQRGEEEADFELAGHEVKTLRLCFSPKSAETFEGELLLKAQIQPNPMLDVPLTEAAAAAAREAGLLRDAAAPGKGQEKFSSSSSRGSSSSKRVLLVGSGIVPKLEVEKRVVDLGPLTVGSKVVTQLCVKNPTAAEIYFNVECQSCLPNENESGDGGSAAALEVYRQPNLLHSRCSSTLKLALTPLLAKPFRFRVSLLPAEVTAQAQSQHLDSQPKKEAGHLLKKKSEPLCCFLVEGEGSVPTVHLADVRYLSPSQESPFSLWQQFQAQQINRVFCSLRCLYSYFSSPPSAADAAFASAEGLEARRAAVEALSRIPCFCGFYLENSAQLQTTILLTFFNPGPTRTDVRFFTHKQFQILALPAWMETHQQEENQEEPAMLRPESFSVPPREYRQVVLQLQHQNARGRKERGMGDKGEKENEQGARLDKTEVVFHVKLGRTLRLLLVSEAVNANAPFLFCPPLVKVHPVAIGRPEGCWRSFVLHNKSDVPACWQLTASPTKETRLMGNELVALTPNNGVLGARSAVYIHVCLSLAQQGNHLFPLLVKYKNYALEGSADAANTQGNSEQTLSFDLATTGCTDIPPVGFGVDENYHSRVSHVLQKISIFPREGVLEAGESCLIWICLHLPSFEMKLKQETIQRLQHQQQEQQQQQRRLTAGSAEKTAPRITQHLPEIFAIAAAVAAAVAIATPLILLSLDLQKFVQTRGACIKAAERQRAFPAASGAPCGSISSSEANAKVVGEGCHPQHMHAVEGPLFLLIEAETSQLLEAQMQIIHRNPPLLPFIQQPHRPGAGHPKGWFERAPVDQNQIGYPLLDHGGSFSVSGKIPEIALQKGPPLPPNLVGEAAAALCTFILNDILMERGTEELLEDLIAEETIPFTTLFPKSCRYTPIHPLKNVSHQQITATATGKAAATTGAATTAPATTLLPTSAREIESAQPLLFYADDFRLWSPLAGHFQQIQTSALQRVDDKVPALPQTAAEATATTTATTAAALTAEESRETDGLNLLITSPIWTVEWLAPVASACLLHLLRETFNDCFAEGFAVSAL
ncbi:hypothetical protein ACSSS7_005343 [Eimeria intestinalis]